MNFIETTHLSEILEESDKKPLIIFKYSNSCGTSERLKKELENAFEKKEIKCPVYLVTVQIQKNLSKKIAEYFGIKHESPQIIILSKGKIIFSANHTFIKVMDLINLS